MLKNLFPARRDSAITVTVAMFAALLLFTFYASNFDTGTFAITLLTGVLRAMLLFLVAAGLSLIFGLMDILNFAQGGYFMLGAYLTYDFVHPQMGIFRFGGAIEDVTLRFGVGLALATLIGGFLGYVLERGLLRPLYKRPLFQLVLTFGVSIILLEAVRSIWGPSPYSWIVRLPIQESQFFIVGQQFSTYRLFVILMGLTLMAAVVILLRRTRIGIIIRAGVQDPEMVSALGINVRGVFTLVFTIGCALAALGGGVAVPFLGATNTLGSTFLLAGIAVIVLGGLGSFEGTAIGSFIVGIGWAAMEVFSVRPEIGTVWASLAPMLLLALVLLLRPKGLFGEDR
jgi:branched-chain amino acid transport system permease protein